MRTLIVCFISRGRRGGDPDSLGSDFGIIDDGEQVRVICPDNGPPRRMCNDPIPDDYLAAINSYERLDGRTTKRFPDAGFYEPIKTTTPYGTFIK